MSHRSKRTRLGVNASRSLDNRRNQQLVDSFFFLVDDNGEPVQWDLELGPPTALMRLGWRRDSLQPGTAVTVEGFMSRTAPLGANARSVKLADGREVFAGSSFDTTE